MINIKSGCVRGSYEYTENWPLSSFNNNQRKWSKKVNFQDEFEEPPEIFVSLSSFQIANTGTDYRIAVSVEDVTTKSFVLSISTWNQTIVTNAEAVWLAFDSKKSKEPGTMIQIGSHKVHKNSTLLDGMGLRSISDEINFPLEFTDKPLMAVGFSMVDYLYGSKYMNIKCQHRNEDKRKFELQLSTSDESKIWSTSINWIAFDPSFKNNDQFQVLINKCRFDSNSIVHYRLSYGEGRKEERLMANYDKPFTHHPNLIAFPNALNLITYDIGREFSPSIFTKAYGQIESAFELALFTYGCIKSAEITYIAIGKPGRVVFNGFGPNNNYIPQNYYVPPPQFNFNYQQQQQQNINDMVIMPVYPNNAQQNNNDNVQNDNDNAQNDNDNAQNNNNNEGGNQQNEEKEIKHECKICFDAGVETVFIPCGHMCACYNCAINVMSKFQKQCPICKAEVKNIVKTYLV